MSLGHRSRRIGPEREWPRPCPPAPLDGATVQAIRSRDRSRLDDETFGHASKLGGGHPRMRKQCPFGGAVCVRSPGEESPQRKEGGIPWGEWDAATSDTAVRGWVGCRNAESNVRPGKSIRNITRPSKQTHQAVTDISIES
jgi:hypothetical protein